MNTQRLKIKEAIQVLMEAQNHRAFQRIAIHLAKRIWPELRATEEQSDGGERHAPIGYNWPGSGRIWLARKKSFHPDIELLKKFGGLWELL